MAFCANCGAQMADTATFCPGCGRPAAGSAPAGPTPSSSYGTGGGHASRTAPQPLPLNAEDAKGFLAALFDLSFTSFIATKLIKVLYVLCILGAAVAALGLAASGFSQGVAVGLLMLVIVAPIVFLLSVIYARVLLEIIIVVFRAAEHLAEMAERGRPLA